MTDERRYGEEEISEIFEKAATERDSGERALPSAEGLTLAELQEIGHEVGLAPERIAEAASALALRRDASPSPRTHFGMPIAVGLTVDLPRAPTDHEWELLVAELRKTFRARGKIGSHGSLREWTNGNLHAYIEPTETGHRLRMGTLKGNALAMSRMGIGGIVMGLILFAPVLFGLMGGAALTSSVLSLPRWAREREEQMEYVASRARALIGSEPEAESED